MPFQKQTPEQVRSHRTGAFFACHDTLIARFCPQAELPPLVWPIEHRAEVVVRATGISWHGWRVGNKQYLLNVECDAGPRFRISIGAADTEDATRFGDAIRDGIRDKLRTIAQEKDIADTNVSLGLTRGHGSALCASEQSHIFGVETPATLTLSPASQSTWPKRRSGRAGT